MHSSTSCNQNSKDRGLEENRSLVSSWVRNLHRAGHPQQQQQQQQQTQTQQRQQQHERQQLDVHKPRAVDAPAAGNNPTSTYRNLRFVSDTCCPLVPRPSEDMRL